MLRQDFLQSNLPDAPGVYFFRDEHGKILYIGKATSLRDRVRSYFAPDLADTRGPHIAAMVSCAAAVTHEETPSVLEALILEANLIKKYQPHYNRQEKDDKSFNCVVVTKEPYPRILLVRQKDIDAKDKTFLLNGKQLRYDAYFGPYTSGLAIREALKIIRGIFPFRDRASAQKDKEAFYRQIRLSPDLSTDQAARQYRQNIGRIKRILQGKLRSLVHDLKKEMERHAAAQRFEDAALLREKIFALEHIQDVSLIKRDRPAYRHARADAFRIEAYDIAHLSGKGMVGVMVVVENEAAQKGEYRKFIVRGFDKANDAGALKEILTRRFNHPEWPQPQVIVVDGNIIQMNAAKEALAQAGKSIPVIAVTKDERHKPKALTGDTALIESHKYGFLLANSEAHRFALSFHTHRRRKAMI